MHKKLLLAAVIIVLFVGTVLFIRNEIVSTPGAKHSSTSNNTSDDTKEESTFDKKRYSVSSPSSLWVVVNKQRPLPSTYVPAELTTPAVPLRGGSDRMLRKEAASALEQMAKAAKKQGTQLMLVSGYRSYGSQQAIYNNFVKQDGVVAANRYSARPGHSEHQTGLAADVGSTTGQCQLQECFANTTAGKWVAKHAPEYGFIVRYQKGQEAKVGYSFEPWHLRFVGKDLAREVTDAKQTLEEFFGLPAAPDYN